MSARRKPASSRARFAARARAARLQALRPVGLLTAVVLVLVGLGWVVLSSSLLAVHDVSVRGEQRIAKAEVLAALGPVKGEALATIDLGVLRHRVEQLAGVRTVEIARHWPSTLDVSVVERTPIGTVHRADGWWLVDNQGVEFGPAGPRLPRLRELRLPAPGASSDAARAAAAVLSALPAPLLALVTTVQASSEDGVALVLSTGAAVVWGSPDRSADKARILTTLVRHKAHVYDVSSPSVVTTR